ncbi:MAG: hypothetical protein NVSMB17_09530 [Candidatus Dormibacteria bacterium]
MALLGLRVIAFLAGVYLVSSTLLSALQTFVLPRAANTRLARISFTVTRMVMDRRTRGASYEVRDRTLALLAPVGLMVLPVMWLVLVFAGFTLVFWGLGIDPIGEAVLVSGSSLFTLGFEHPDSRRFYAALLFGFVESAIGLGLLALLISYLPTIYSAFSRRETVVSMLEPLAGSPPSAVTLLMRHHRVSGIDRLDASWRRYQEWFADIEESHTSLAALVFFRSPQPSRSWVTAAGCILDAAALTASSLDLQRSADAELCIRAGFITLRRIADFFAVSYDVNPQPGDPTSIGPAEFAEAYEALRAAGLPMKADMEKCFRDFSGWRVNADTGLLHPAGRTAAPPAPGSSDRMIPYQAPPLHVLFRRRRVEPPPVYER